MSILALVDGWRLRPVDGLRRRPHVLWSTRESGNHPCPRPRPATTVVAMCRNITELRGLEPAASDEEVEAAARQYVRKVSGITHPTDRTRDAFERAVAEIAHITEHLLADLPDRRQPPQTVPPLRRPEVRARIAEREAAKLAAS